MYTVWHVDKYKITFKLVISHWTNEMSFSTPSRILFSSEYFHYKKTRIILLLMRTTSIHVYVLERYDICMIRAIPVLRVTSNHAYVVSL